MVSETLRVLQHLLQLGHLLVPAVVAHLLDHRPNYRRHSALGWQTPASRYTGRAMTIQGLAGIPGLEPMANDPRWGTSYCDPPVEIAPFTAQNARAIVVWTESAAV
jgi:hypothetical protein